MTKVPDLYTEKTLVLFTVDFPYGNYESSFIPQELAVLSTRFKHIYVVPFITKPQQKSALPANVSVLKINDLEARGKSIADYLLALRLFMGELLQTGNTRLLKRSRYHISELLNYLALSKKIKLAFEQNNLTPQNSIVYTYWFETWNKALCILKKKEYETMRLVSRAHGFDLYEYRDPHGYIFLRKLQLNYTDAVFSVSANGTNYLREKYPFASARIDHARLGINRDQPLSALQTTTNELVLVSCSDVIPLKRVHKIAEILSCCKKNIRWVHFGDGELMPDIKKRVAQLPPNITAELRGFVPNAQVKQFYLSTPIDWFINVSEYEGVPVSIMEAISFGIPVIGTNVGGVSEIVNTTTGFLAEKDFDPAYIAGVLENNVFTEDKRKLVADFWDKNYNAESVYSAFAKRLISAE